MKTFTKSMMVAVALMAGATTASAQDDGWMDPEQWVEVSADMWHEWSNPGDVETCSKDAEIVGDVTPVWALNTDVGGGGCIIGAENVNYNQYVDLSDYDKLILFGTGGPGCRVMCNRIVHEGAWKNLVIGFNEEDSHWNADLEALVIDLSEFKTMEVTANGGSPDGMETGQERADDFVHLHCLKNAWGGVFPINVSAVYIWKAGGTETGIKGIKTASTNGKTYNLQGQEVKNPQKGIFIQNGKKILVK